jgi:hypothetical protein
MDDRNGTTLGMLVDPGSAYFEIGRHLFSGPKAIHREGIGHDASSGGSRAVAKRANAVRHSFLIAAARSSVAPKLGQAEPEVLPALLTWDVQSMEGAQI